jgi:hypothetical protein
MKLSPSERMTVEKAIKSTNELWAKQQINPRQRFVATITMVEALVQHLAETHGRRPTWEWLQRMADELLEEELP